MSVEHYEALTGSSSSIIDLLALPGAESFKFNAPRVRKLSRTAGLG